jgi:hypothetical protein
MTVYEELGKHAEAKNCGGLSYLASADEGLPDAPNLDSYFPNPPQQGRTPAYDASGPASVESRPAQETRSNRLRTRARIFFAPLPLEHGAVSDDGHH